MAKRITLPDGSVWEAQGGLSRRYRLIEIGGEPVSGGTLSRRQFDRLSGRLGIFSSYEKKAAASEPEVRASRPARGRARPKPASGIDFSHRGPLAGKMTRNLSIPFAVDLEPMMAEGEFYRDAIEYYTEYNDAISTLQRNAKALYVQINATFKKAGRESTITVIRPTYPIELPAFITFIGHLYSIMTGSENYDFGESEDITQFLTIDFRIGFQQKFLKPSKRPKHRQLKTKRPRKKARK